MKQYKIAILGSEDSTAGFRGLGVDAPGLTVKNAEEVVGKIMSSDKYAVVFVLEDWSSRLENVLEKYWDRALPAVVTVPSSKGATGEAMANLKKIVEQAVGSDILFSKE